jgi:hypothetical protein
MPPRTTNPALAAFNPMNSNLRTQRWTSLALIVAVGILLVIVASIALVSWTYHDMVLGGRWAMDSEWLHSVDVQTRAAALGQLGSYFGGTLNPILSFCGFLVLLVTVVLQRRQLEEGTRQLAQSTRAIDLEAFVRVNDSLQSPDGIAARERLLAMARAGQAQQPFEQWALADQRAAQTVGRQFELVGLLIEGRLFDPDLFLRSWHHMVVQCWQACAALVTYQRVELQDNGYCRHFEELQVLARARRPVVASQLGHAVA